MPVFEVGQDGESAYYAMQFIQGQGLDQVIDELARLPQSGTARMSRPSRRPSGSAADRDRLGQGGASGSRNRTLRPDGRIAPDGRLGTDRGR